MDRFSWLPDEIICHILSFLWTKDSVRTSVLSKRWKFLWTRVPFLGFSIFDTITVNIVTKILLQHKHDIHTCRLLMEDTEDFHGDTEEAFQSLVVNITSSRNVRKLVIGMDNFDFNLPRSLFTCQTLVKLSLDICGDIPMSGIYFPALKKLKLEHVEYESQESLAHLISGCPVLEELSIQDRNLGQCCVSSPTITRLDLHLDYSDIISNFRVKLDTPKLMCLWLECSMPLSDEFSVGALDSLIGAYIDLYWGKEHRENFDYSRCVLALVSKLNNVKRLTLKTPQIAMIHDSAFSALAIKFHNLTELSLFSSLGVIKCFLKNANNLRFLQLEIHNVGDIDNQYWMKPRQVPRCLVSRLLTVTVSNFMCFEHEFDVVRYILMNAKVLKSMKILTRGRDIDLEKKFKTLKRVALFKRGSQECELEFD